MQRFLVVFFLLATVTCKSQKRGISWSNIESSDTLIHYMGRVDVKEDAAMLSWSGTAVTINFEGTGVTAVLKDERGENTFNVIVDGEVRKIIHPDTTKRAYVLVAGLAKGKHTLELYKRTEWAMGRAWFYKFKVMGKTLPAPAVKKRKIEFFGNSITCGYAVEDTTGQDRGSAPYENGYISYAAITARHYDAEFSSISKSGIGVMLSWFPIIMPEMYDRLDPTDAASKWDFSKYTPDLVVINLLQNDSWLIAKPDHAQFKARFGDKAPGPDQIITAYRNLVRSIRAKYPDAFIICALGSMDAARKEAPWFGYIEKAVAALKDAKIYTHSFGYKGTGGHPSAKEQAAMAADLIGFYRQGNKMVIMKKGWLVLLLIVLISCNMTPQETAEANVKSYMLTHSLHPQTYEGIDFEKIEKDSVSEYPYHISHLFRSKSKAGEMVVSHRVFFLDTVYAVKKDISLKEYNELKN